MSAFVLRVAATRRRFARGARGSEGRLVQVATVAVAVSGGGGERRGVNVRQTCQEWKGQLRLRTGLPCMQRRGQPQRAAQNQAMSRAMQVVVVGTCGRHAKSGDESGDASGGGGDLRQARLAAGACAAGACAAGTCATGVSVAASTRGRVAALRTMAACAAAGQGGAGHDDCADPPARAPSDRGACACGGAGGPWSPRRRRRQRRR